MIIVRLSSGKSFWKYVFKFKKYEILLMHTIYFKRLLILSLIQLEEI